MVSFRCQECNFAFKSDKKKRCPYCNSENVEKEKSASEIVDKVNVK